MNVNSCTKTDDIRKASRRTSRGLRAVLALLALFLNPAYADDAVVAFTINTIPIIGATSNDMICHIGKGQAEMAVIKQQLHRQNRITISQYYQTHRAVVAQAALDMGCDYQAKLLGIHKVPAIVFNQKYVIYGLTNIAQAKVLKDELMEPAHD